MNTLRDYMGTVHRPAPDARILSLVPSLTELLFALGIEDRLVGRTHFCIHPKPEIDAYPSVGGTKKIKMKRVDELAPTHALVNVDENPKEMADDLEAQGIDVIVTHPSHPDENPALYKLIGGVFGADDAAARLSDDYRTARDRLATAACPEKRALYMIWKAPWMAVSRDTYIAQTLGLVNWRIGDFDTRYPEISFDEETLGNVDLVFFSTEPYAFTEDDIAAFKAAFPDHASKAHLIDGEMTSWYGSRAVAGLDYLGRLAAEIDR